MYSDPILHHTEMNEQRRTVFLNRYALRDTTGETIETEPSQMWDRVAQDIGTTQEERAAFRKILQDFRFVPGGRILAGAGTKTEVTYYNCYVIPLETRVRRTKRGMNNEQIVLSFPDDATPEEVESMRSDMRLNLSKDSGSDSREAILDTISVMVDIMSRGGGVGINWSVLRPKGTHLSRVNGTTSGPVSWMDVASHAVQTVTQGGSRRGAAMFMLDDWHPDVMEFINAKRDLTKITGANVSVAVSDEFMDAVRNDRVWDLVFPDTKDVHYDSEWDGNLAGWREKGYPVVVHDSVPARSIWRNLAQAAWDNGEPGVVFLGRYNLASTGSDVERIICVNPCGEQGLGPYSVCNLGSMNLDAYIVERYNAKRYNGQKEYEFDWARFIEDTKTAVTFLDNVVDKNYYFLPENEKVQKELRRIGLGVMGLADAMIALKLRYGSPESVKFVDKLFSTMKNAAIYQSNHLAQAKGKAPAWDLKTTYRKPFFRDILDTPLGGQVRRHGLRNMFLLTQAPTGSTSILTGVNSGIEPYFAFEYTRVDRTGTHKVIAQALEKYVYQGASMPDYCVTSNDVTVEEHIAIQAAAQRHIDSSVSKTINAPNNHTVEDVEKAYTLAYDSGLKGLAYFRDGNGRDQVLYKEEPKKDEPLSFNPEPDDELWGQLAELTALAPSFAEYQRPTVLDGTTTKVQTRAGTAYVTVNRDPSGGRPVEVFFNVGKAGSEVAALAEGLGRLASLALRSGATLGGVANQLDGVGGTSKFNQSICHAIAQALTTENARPAIVPKTEPEVAITVSNPDGEFEFAGRLVRSEPAGGSGKFDLCPECHNASLSHQEGCSKCALCGYSAC